MRSSVTRLARLLYIGLNLSRMHLVSYVVNGLSAALWLLVVFVPTVVLTGHPLHAFRVFLPGVFAMSVGAIGMWIATEFTRWSVYQGLTDMFRECGLGVLHYLVSCVIVDCVAMSVATYFITACGVAAYISSSLSIVLPQNPLLFLYAVALSVAPYLLCGAATALLYVRTRISGAWTNLFQMALALGTVVPPKAFGIPWLALVNPATVVAEVMRCAYGAPSIPPSILLPLAPIIAGIEIALAIALAERADREIALRGIEFRF